VVFEVIPEEAFKRNCERMKKRWSKVLNLLEAQKKTIEDFQKTHEKIDEKTTRLVQEDANEICDVFNELVETSETLKKLEIDRHPIFPELKERIDGIREVCEKCSRPLIGELAPEILREKRFMCLFAEEKITYTAHSTALMEDVLVDNAQPDYYSILHKWIREVKNGHVPPHDFYEALLAYDTIEANKLLEKQRKFVEGGKCE